MASKCKEKRGGCGAERRDEDGGHGIVVSRIDFVWPRNFNGSHHPGEAFSPVATDAIGMSCLDTIIVPMN